MIKALLFDLDGTLLPMDEPLFTKIYIGNLAKKFIGSELPADKIPQAILNGLQKMVTNDGKTTNEVQFWKAFDQVVQMDHTPFIPQFNEYYANEFIQAKSGCGFHPAAKEIIELCKEKKIDRILATNPIFPTMATYQRVVWAGLTTEDFSVITTFEDYHFCKPNPDYFKEILNKTGYQSDEVIMIGNDTKEDYAAVSLGIPLILVTDTVKGDPDSIECMFKGTLAEVKDYLESIL